jgi:hypothetical protein
MGSVVYRFMPCDRAAGAATDARPGERRGRTDR